MLAMSETDSQVISIIGGTGDQGLGLALRFAKAGKFVVIGSRDLAKAVTAAEEVRRAVPGANVVGVDNKEATTRGEIVILSVPFEHSLATIRSTLDSFSAGQVLVSMAVPLGKSGGDGESGDKSGRRRSAAELIADAVPAGVEVVAAFQNVSAHRLQCLDDEVECDVLVSGPKGPRQAVMELCALVPGLRAVDGGPLSNARFVEHLTEMLIGLNRRYKIPEGVGIRITGLPDS